MLKLNCSKVIFFSLTMAFLLSIPVQSRCSSRFDEESGEDFCNKNEGLVIVPNTLSIPPDYNKNIKPPGSPCQVRIGFIVEDVMEVNDEDYTVSMKIGIPLYWNDSRLDLNVTSIEKIPKGRWLHVEPELKEEIWFPNVIINHMLHFETINTITSNEKLMITDMKDLRFYYIAIHLVRFTCELRFENFPFDEHNCYFEAYFESPSEEVRLDFFRGSQLLWGTANTSTILSYDTTFQPLPEDRLNKVHTSFSGYNITHTVAGFKIMLSRKISVYVFNYYIPSGLFVVVSWVSLIIPPDAIPGRIALIITTFLVLVNIANTVFSSSPTADSINPIQVWILACITFVFITVLEYTYILFIMRRVKKQILNQSNQEKKKNNVNKLSVLSSNSESKAVTTPSSKSNSIAPDMPYANGSIIKERLKDMENGMYHVGDDIEDGSKWFRFPRSQRLVEIKEKLLATWQRLKVKLNSNLNEVDLQIWMTNVDYAFVWVVITLFLLFNAIYWNWY